MNLHGAYTPGGRLLRTKLLAGEGNLTVSRVMAGSGSTDAETALTLAEERQQLAVGERQVAESVVTLPVTLVAADAAEDYNFTEAGVYVLSGGEEILYSVYRLYGGLRVAAGSQLVVRMDLTEQFEEVPSVEVLGSSKGLLTMGDLRALLGAADGIAALDGDALVPVDQMPYSCTDEEPEAGVTYLESGKLLFVYE